MMHLDSIFAASHGLVSLLSPAVAQSAGAAAGATMVTAIWQGLLLALGVAGVLKVVRRTTADLRFSIWVAAFAAAVCMPFWPVLWSRLATYASLPAASLANAHSAPWTSSPWIQVDLRWSIALASLWAAASLYRAIDLAIHAVRLRALWKDATPVPAEKLNLLSILENSSHAGRHIEVCTTLKQDRPGVIGFFAPRILIPEWLLDRLTPAELTQIVLHETEHIRRGDDWTNLLQKVGLVLFPLNPALLWMDRRLCLEREMACDEAVVRATRAPRAYATCLTNLAEHGRAWRNQAIVRATLTLGAWRRRSELVGRVQSILRSKNAAEAGVGKLQSRGIFAVLACGLIVGSAELARCPQLIAFVPAPSESAHSEPAYSEQVASAPAHPEATEQRIAQPTMGIVQKVSTRGLGHARVTNLRATVPARDAASYMTYNDIPASKPASGWKATPVTLRKVVPAHRNRDFGPSTRAAAQDISSPMPSSGRDEQAESATGSAQQEGWLVLTTWEEVATAETASPSMIDASSRATEAELAAAPSKQAGQQETQQIRVTRVVFRVLPASFVSPSPNVARTRATLRDGWLVLQL
jgi:beta-lactamase regulating signal transducer with metallopeptidase domain